MEEGGCGMSFVMDLYDDNEDEEFNGGWWGH
jgi:hypothetical protein